MYTFQKPQELWKSIDRTIEGFVYDRRFQKEREACVISMFGAGYGMVAKSQACCVRLVEGREPIEAELKTETELLGFQIAMAIEKGRKLKEEYQSSEKFKLFRPADFEEFAERIEEIVKKKMRKYGTAKGVNLLIYDNMSFEGLNAQKIVDRFKGLAADFDSIWLVMATFVQDKENIMTGHAIIKIAPDPSPGFYAYTDEELGFEKISKKAGWIVGS